MYSLPNLSSSETIEENGPAAEYGAAMELNARIFKARSDAKMTQEDLAKAVGKTRGAVAQWESGDVRPRHSTLLAIAAATNTSMHWLLQGGEDELSGPRVGLKVVGEVSAGTWREGNVYYPVEIKPVATHPDYPSFAQRLYKVDGTSINMVAQSGEYLHAVEVRAIDIKPEAGDLVIVRRTLHGLAEYTAKQLIFKDGAWWLRPESTDPAWQDDIPVDGDKGAEVEITDIVIAKWSPIARRRTPTKVDPDPFFLP